ncbi:MAG TPA: class I SAM-dependent methyltransferase [Alphaproteobacteria bacterium]|nr:class I SAM-dependent methyltransferase [Alphaproteobacteria bacterium]
MTASPTCPVCGGARAEPFHVHSAGRLLRCVGCGMIWLDPPPDPATLDALYADAYEGATAGYFTKAERKLKRSAGRVRQICRALGAAPEGKRFLDVGANGGFMSEAARRAGFEVTGVEPDGKSLAYAAEHFPGIRFVHGFVEQAPLEPASFDAVYCSEVIEHSADCNAFVAALARAMKPGAVLYLTTPDISHWRRPRDLETWDAFCPPSHCLYFSPATLARLLARHGLDVVRRRIAFKPGIKLIARKRRAVAEAA